jgi:hypothetical protein
VACIPCATLRSNAEVIGCPSPTSQGAILFELAYSSYCALTPDSETQVGIIFDTRTVRLAAPSCSLIVVGESLPAEQVIWSGRLWPSDCVCSSLHRLLFACLDPLSPRR